MNEELKKALDALDVKLEGKSKEEIKAAIDGFKEEYKELLNTDTKAFDVFKTANTETLEGLQKHLDALDVRVKNNTTVKALDTKGKDPIQELITKNFDEIKLVSKGKAISLEAKAVGDMTLATSLTGDQPRDYSFVTAMVPGQLVNFSDLVSAITISGGTYTFPRETGSEGAIATQTEGSAKSQIDYDLTMVDVNTDFIAGFAVYSKKMANNLPFLESFLPTALRRDYFIEENDTFNTVLAAAATSSAQIITGKNKIQMLINELATLEGINFAATTIVVRPADFYDILTTEVSTGAGYGLPGIVTFDNGQLRINGIMVVRANWLAANKYYVGDFTRIKKVITEGMSVEFSNEDSDNFRKNNITARVESQVGLAIERTDAVIFGDFTAI